MSLVLSRILSIFFAVVSIFLPAQPENVKLTVGQVTTQSTSLSFQLENNTGRMIGRPLAVLIENQNENGNWQEADIGCGHTDIGYNVYPGQTASESVILALDHKEDSRRLKEGLHRITVEYAVKSLSKIEKVRVTEEFTVIEAK